MPTHVTAEEAIAEFAADIRNGLARAGQKELPSKYLYDSIGSALFEAISLLPEYGATRAESRLLRHHAAEIVARLPFPMVVAELGSGSGVKTRWLLEALCQRQPTAYFPIEISPAALAMCRRQLSDIDSISIVGYESEYLDGLEQVSADRHPGAHLLVLFLGGTIGNFDRPAGVNFLAEVRRALQPGDCLLLGTDLEKPVPRLLHAYDDPTGVTAAFNRNLLARINRELGADFQLVAYDHVVRYDAEERRIEMHLRARSRQAVFIPKADLRVTIEAGETIWTESSHKYSRQEPYRMAEEAGFRCAAQWADESWGFADNLWIAE